MEESKSGEGESELRRRAEEVWRAEGPKQTCPQEAPAASLNCLFEKLPVSLVPPVRLGKVVEVPSDASLAEAIRILAAHGILSAPVRNAAAGEDASWMERYVGLVDFPGIVVWVLSHSDVDALSHMEDSLPSPRPGTTLAGIPLSPPSSPSARAAQAVRSPSSPRSGFGFGAEGGGMTEAAASGAAAAVTGDFFSLLRNSTQLQNTKVADVVGSFRWAPFIPLTPQDSLLTLLLLVSAYRARTIPVVEPGTGPLINVITQTTVAAVLLDCIRLPGLRPWASRTLASLTLPSVTGDAVITVHDRAPVLEPFRLMLAHGVGGVPVVAKGTRRLVGSVAIRDIQLLLLHPALFANHKTLRVYDFMSLARKLAAPDCAASSVGKAPVAVSQESSVQEVLELLQAARVQRAYVTDSSGELRGVVTLRDIVGRLVLEPPGYFGDFFQSVVPASHPEASAA